MFVFHVKSSVGEGKDTGLSVTVGTDMQVSEQVNVAVYVVA
jgi:hypothetical protein